MYSTRLLKGFIAVSFVGLLAGCSSSSGASSPGLPVIDDLTLPDTATVATVQTSSGAQQAYDIKGSISFHDDKESVTQYKIHIDIPGVTVPDLTQGVPATAKSTDQQFEILLDQSAPKGPADITITLYGASGAASDPSKKTVTLQ